MKKEYINPEMLVVGFQTQGILALSIKEGTADKNDILAPTYDDEDDDEDWGDEEDAVGGRRKVY